MPSHELAPAALCAAIPEIDPDRGARNPAGWCDIARLDHLSATPVLRAARAAAPSAGAIDDAQRMVARFVGARPGDQITFTSTPAEAWRVLADARPSHTRVLQVTCAEAPAPAAIPGAHILALSIHTSPEEKAVTLAAALGEAGRRIGLLVVPGACGLTGEVAPLHQLVAVAHQFGVPVAVDAGALARHRPLDLAGTGADVLVFSGADVYALVDIGVIAGRREWLAPTAFGMPSGQLRPTAATTAGAPPPCAEVSDAAVAVLAAACRVMIEHRGDIALYEHSLASRLRVGIQGVRGAQVHRRTASCADALPIVTFDLEGQDAHRVAAVLAQDFGITVGTRRVLGPVRSAEAQEPGIAGDERLREYAAVQVSLGLATRPHHVERLVAALSALADSRVTSLTRGPREAA